MNLIPLHRQQRAALLSWLCLLALSVTPCLATDVARAPISFLQSAQVKPNIFFILDDSGSMQVSFMGDEIVQHGYENKIGYRSSACNKIYYDPAVLYPVPVGANGKSLEPQNFYRARYDGFQPASVSVDLSREFMPWRNSLTVPRVPQSTDTTFYIEDCSGGNGEVCRPDLNGPLPNVPGPAHYYLYKGAQPARLGDNSSQDHCHDTRFDVSPAGTANWIRVNVGSRSGPGGSDERQNFANWFSYHRTRMLTMKTAIGHAFASLDEHYRVGFSTISYSGTDTQHPGFLKIADFNAAHRQQFYSKIYATLPLSSTPLRAALAKAGRLYAGQLLKGADDPVQYACQQHFTILSTDGYWNTAAESPSYGPVRIDGRTPIGDIDHALPRPQQDGDPANTRLRVATISVIVDGAARATPYTWVQNLTVNGQSVLVRSAGVEHTAQPQADAFQLASRLAASVGAQGFRAVSRGSEVLLIAPAGNDSLLAVPQIAVQGSLRLVASSFQDVPRNGRTADTLADVAAYYFLTDLRAPALGNCQSLTDVCPDTVPVRPVSRDGNHQHMVTHTIGLGASGILRYRHDYDSAPDGDFRRIVDGQIGWPDPIYFSGSERIDDLWHAAVNGGGRYFNASNSPALARALADTLAGIRARNSTAAAVATRSQELPSADERVFVTRYRSVYWDGDVHARRLQSDATASSDGLIWSAAAQLSRRLSAASDTRRILLGAATAPRGLKEFRWSELNATERSHFTARCLRSTPSTVLSQCPRLSAEHRVLASGERLLNYLRGQWAHEDRADTAVPLFRRREQVLGAPIHAQPLYVGPPAFRYADDHYAAFRDGVAAQRPAVVYVAANDGMLHAFDAGTGDELWAFIPQGVLPRLWESADAAFAQRFRYLLDGSPVAADICPYAPQRACDASEWRTLLVGGFGAGGREYYALDITDPRQPAALWRFNTDHAPNLGEALARPVITKRRDGTWVVVVSSGYNNVEPGDGRGYLFVLNAASGALLEAISTGEGSVAEPAGLGPVNAWIEQTFDNTATRFYAGDLAGNVWRFDIDDQVPPAGREATRLATLVRAGLPQPITTRIELSDIRQGSQRLPVVTVATGRLLGVSDLADKSIQSVYTLTDPLLAQGHGDVRASGRLVQQRLQLADDGQRSISAHPVDWRNDPGWYVDLDADPQSGERVTLDPEQQQGVLRFVANVPDGSICRAAAHSWLYTLDVQSGSYWPLPGQRLAAQRISDLNLTTGVRWMRAGGQALSLVNEESGALKTITHTSASPPAQSVRRVSWYELDD